MVRYFHFHLFPVLFPPVVSQNQVILKLLQSHYTRNLFTSNFERNSKTMAPAAGEAGQSTSGYDSSKGNGLLLYFHNYSYYSQKVVMALHEKKLAFKTHFVNIVKSEQYQPWFLEMNPRGEVPVLKDGVKIIPDSSRIIDYLEDNFSNGKTPKLVPRDQGLEIRQSVEYFRSIIDPLPAGIITMGSFLHQDLVGSPKMPFIAPVRRMLSGADRRAAENLRAVADTVASAHNVLVQKSDHQEVKRQNITNREQYIRILDQVDDVLSKVEEKLKSHENNPEYWLCCPTFTVADIALTILLERLYRLGLENRFWAGGRRPCIEKYYQRVQKRDSYIKTIPTPLVHLEIFVRMSSPLIIGTCIAAAVAVIAGGIFFWHNYST